MSGTEDFSGNSTGFESDIGYESAGGLTREELRHTQRQCTSCGQGRLRKDESGAIKCNRCGIVVQEQGTTNENEYTKRAGRVVPKRRIKTREERSKLVIQTPWAECIEQVVVLMASRVCKLGLSPDIKDDAVSQFRAYFANTRDSTDDTDENDPKRVKSKNPSVLQKESKNPNIILVILYSIVMKHRYTIFLPEFIQLFRDEKLPWFECAVYKFPKTSIEFQKYLVAFEAPPSSTKEIRRLFVKYCRKMIISMPPINSRAWLMHIYKDILHFPSKLWSAEYMTTKTIKIMNIVMKTSDPNIFLETDLVKSIKGIEKRSYLGKVYLDDEGDSDSEPSKKTKKKSTESQSTLFLSDVLIPFALVTMRLTFGCSEVEVNHPFARDLMKKLILHEKYRELHVPSFKFENMVLLDEDVETKRSRSFFAWDSIIESLGFSTDVTPIETVDFSVLGNKEKYGMEMKEKVLLKYHVPWSDEDEDILFSEREDQLELLHFATKFYVEYLSKWCGIPTSKINILHRVFVGNIISQSKEPSKKALKTNPDLKDPDFILPLVFISDC